MCCAFNYDAAEDLFVSSSYTSIVTKLQKEDALGSYENSVPPGVKLSYVESMKGKIRHVKT